MFLSYFLFTSFILLCSDLVELHVRSLKVDLCVCRKPGTCTPSKCSTTWAFWGRWTSRWESSKSWRNSTTRTLSSCLPWRKRSVRRPLSEFSLRKCWLFLIKVAKLYSSFLRTASGNGVTLTAPDKVTLALALAFNESLLLLPVKLSVGCRVQKSLNKFIVTTPEC